MPSPPSILPSGPVLVLVYRSFSSLSFFLLFSVFIRFISHLSRRSLFPANASYITNKNTVVTSLNHSSKRAIFYDTILCCTLFSILNHFPALLPSRKVRHVSPSILQWLLDIQIVTIMNVLSLCCHQKFSFHFFVSNFKI